MSRAALLDALGESHTIFHYEQDGKFAIETRHDDTGAKNLVTEINQMGLSGKADGMRQERIIPAHVLDRAFQEGWFNDKAAWKRWANGSEGMLYAIEYNGRKNQL